MLSGMRAAGRRAAWVGAAVTCGAVTIGLSPMLEEPAPGSGIAWEDSFPKALKRARATGKPVMADFWAEWCHWCAKFDEVTYEDSGVIELSRRFIPVKVHTEGGLEEREITYEYQVADLPTVAFFSPEGHLLARLGHYQGPEDFEATLLAALATADRVGRWERALEDRDDAVRAEAMASLGAHLFDQRRLDESRKLLEGARKRDEARPVAERKASRVLLGRIRLEQGKEGDAQRLAREALELPPATAAQDAQALLLLGNALHEDGELDAARASWERAAKTDPQSPAAMEAERALRASTEARPEP